MKPWRFERFCAGYIVRRVVYRVADRKRFYQHLEPNRTYPTLAAAIYAVAQQQDA